MSDLTEQLEAAADGKIEYDETSPLQNRPTRRTTFAEEALDAQAQLRSTSGTPSQPPLRSRLPTPAPTFARRKATAAIKDNKGQTQSTKGANPKVTSAEPKTTGLDPWEQDELDKLTEKMRAGMKFPDPVWTPAPNIEPIRSRSVPARLLPSG